MDMLNFNKENIVVLEGTSLPDVPLAQSIFDHEITGSTLTQLVREVDFTQKPKVISKMSDCFDIYAICDLPKQTKLPSEPVYDNLKRIVLKTDNSTA